MKKEDLILVIDMQNVYRKDQPWACMHMNTTIYNIIKILNQAQITGTKVIFTRFIASEQPQGTWQKYNQINHKVNTDPWMNDLIEELQPYTQRYPVYEKPYYSALKVSEIRRAVQQTIHSKGRLVLTGVVDDCCVLSTFFEAVDEGADIIWIKDGCDGISEEKHHSAEVVVQGLAYCHCALMSTDEYLKQ